MERAMSPSTSAPLVEATVRQVNFMDAGCEALCEEMRRDPTVFILGEGIGARGGSFRQTRGLFQEFGPERVRDTPIAELGITGLGVGAAIAGSRPVIDLMFSDFIAEAMSQIVNQAAKFRYISGGQMGVPLLVRAGMGALRSAGAHHSQCPYPSFMNVPGLKVVTPSTPYDEKGLLKAAIHDDDPVIFLEHKSLFNTRGPVPVEEYTIPLGKAVVTRKGDHVTLVAVGLMHLRALEAAEKVAKQALSVEVIDPRTLVPLDLETIVQSVAKTGRLVVVDEAHSRCGLSAEIMALVTEQAFDELDAPIKRVNSLPIPHPFSPVLEEAMLPSVEKIVSALQEVIS